MSLQHREIIMYDWEKLIKISYLPCPDCENPSGAPCDEDGGIHLGRLNAWLAKCGLPSILESNIPGKFITLDYVEPFIEPDDPRDMEMMGS